ncbi:hypothetical protein RND81_04G200600 [Saponaria officinalis]|uniref:Uncharacterized protein n=1 Tax=Saponaria officinalis TaxID=3572 RepID=A0AAW1LQY4_SAPOF
MSGYDYASRSGYAIHTSKPVSVVSYDAGRGTRTVVTRVEERVEQVRKPSTRGYIYSSAGKAEKEGRPREVDDFITKILDEVDGPSVATTRQNDSGCDYKFGANPRSYYAVEYVYVGSPTGSGIPRMYGDPYDVKEFSSLVYDNPPKSYYGGTGRDNPSDYSRVKSEALRDYDVPKTRWERSSYPNYDASPYVLPPVESHTSRTYDAKPENRLKSDPKDYGAPSNRWIDSSVEPLSPNAYESPGNHWSRSSKPVYGNPQQNTQLGKSNDGYGVDLGNQKGRPSSPEYEHPPRNEIIAGAPNNRWSNSPLKTSYDQTLPSIDRQRGDSSLKPQSPKGYGVSDCQGGRSSSPNYDPPQSKVLGEGPKNSGYSPLKPSFGQAPPNDDMGGPSYGRQNALSAKIQSPTSYGAPGNQRGGSTSPDFEHPPRNDIMSGVSNNRWGNSPVETPNNLGSKSLGRDYDSRPPNAYKDNGASDGRRSNSPTKFGSSKGYQVPNDQTGRSVSPMFELPPRNEIVTPLRVRIPQDHGSDNNGVSIGVDSPSPNGNVDGVANNRWSNSPVKTQSPRDYVPRGNQWSSGPSSPAYNAGDDQPNDFGGSNKIKSSGYQASPLSANDKPRDNAGDQRVSSGVPLQPKYSVYSGPASELVTVRPRVIDSREAERRYGHLDAPKDQGRHVITSRDALKKYNGYIF